MRLVKGMTRVWSVVIIQQLCDRDVDLYFIASLHTRRFGGSRGDDRQIVSY